MKMIRGFLTVLICDSFFRQKILLLATKFLLLYNRPFAKIV